jgi:predicted Fe-Mo cluster-binding NifX family protein
MKIAISAEGPDLQSLVAPRFGRAQWFIIADLETGELKAISNEQNRSAAQGAGIQAAENVARHVPSYLITGHCGPKAFRALTAAGIRVVVGAEGSVRDVLEKFKRGELKPAEGPDVTGHWA